MGVLKKNITILLSLILVVASVLSGCSSKDRKKKEGEIYLYYSNSKHNALVEKIYKPVETELINQVGEVLKAMNKKRDGVISAKPQSVMINDYTLYDNTLNIDFDPGYLNMSSATEVLCRSAIVLTLTQLDGIEFVTFTVDNQPVVLKGNTTIGSMKSEDFVDDGGSNINSYQNISTIIYFGNEKGDKLVPVECTGVYEKDTSLEMMIIERLIKGPTDSKYSRTVPSNIKLLNVMTKDGVCYVNFDNEFLESRVSCSVDMEIYSIVNSLAELSHINKVQISVNGNTDVKLFDAISLEYPFTRNLDLVKQE